MNKTGGNKMNKRKFTIYALIFIGFFAMEFPGILFAGDRLYPFIFGLPFLYGYILCCWAYMCMVLFYAYKTSWGKKSFFRKKL